MVRGLVWMEWNWLVKEEADDDDDDDEDEVVVATI